MIPIPEEIIKIFEENWKIEKADGIEITSAEKEKQFLEERQKNKDLPLPVELKYSTITGIEEQYKQSVPVLENCDKIQVFCIRHFEEIPNTNPLMKTIHRHFEIKRFFIPINK